MQTTRLATALDEMVALYSVQVVFHSLLASYITKVFDVLFSRFPQRLTAVLHFQY
jgi:hypothetical protein